MLGVAIPLLFIVKGAWITAIFFREQDAPALIGGGALLFLLSLRAPAWRPRVALSDRWLVAGLAAVALIAGVAGWHLVLQGYALSRDETLVDFDADFLRHGLLVAPVPPAWQPFATALMPMHMLRVPAEAGWLSGYLPVNAALRAAIGAVIGREWTGALLAAIAAVTIYAVGRRLWPDRPRLALLPTLLLALSPQVLAMAMTPYAMTGHLALNLLWLWCFLRDDRRGDTGALAIGFAATGLHQIVFHPLFVAPFLLELLLARRWRRLLVFVGGYLAIGLFWASWWVIALYVDGGPVPAGAVGEPLFAERIAILIDMMNPVSGFPVMLLNLARFVAWQHLLLIPLVLLAWPSIRAGEGIARPAALGVVLMLLMAWLIIPWQGHGWGYRYLHGLIGNLCLLAGYGWRRLPGAERAAGPAALGLTTIVTLGILLPFHLWSMAGLVPPYREARRVITQTPMPIVLVDPSNLMFAQDLVVNRPDLSNRPLILDLGSLDESRIRVLCTRYRPGLFDARSGLALGIRPLGEPPIAQAGLLRSLGCGVPLGR